MAVLDFHFHVGSEDNWNPWVIEHYSQRNPEYAERFSKEIIPEGIEDLLDSQGVDRAVAPAEYAPKTTGVITNEYVHELCGAVDRLIPFGAVCLYEGAQPADQVERCVKKLKCRGIKFSPTYAHFKPFDSRLLPAYETARDLGIPVMFNTGTSLLKGSRIIFGNPLLLDDVADEFRDLTIIMSHAGRPFWHNQAEWMLRRHKNMYIDISGIPPAQLPFLFRHLERYYDRYLFGSDWPGIPSISDQVKMVRNLPYKARTIEAILWGNGARILGLD
jgi:predicted TIM-barrel fold metal-dependent hydrolase